MTARDWKDYPFKIVTSTLTAQEWAIIEVALRMLLLNGRSADPQMVEMISSSTLPHVEHTLRVALGETANTDA